MAERKSAAVSSSHLTESLDCACTEHAAARDKSKEQIIARFIDVPPEPPCILDLIHVFEAPLFGFDAEAEDDNDLHQQKTDDHRDDTANSVGMEKRDGQEGSKDGRAAPEGVADARSAQTNLGGKKFGDVDRDRDGDE